MDSGRVFAVAGAKGGVGKTTTSINLGVALRDHGFDVVVVELDLAMANVVDFLSLPFDQDTHPSMHDVLAGDAAVTDVIVEAPGDVAVAPSTTALDGLDAVDISRLPDVIDAFADRFDAVVVDTAAGMNSATTAAIGAADETILVSTPRVASVRDAKKTRTLVETGGGEVIGVVMSKAGTGTAPESRRLASFLGVDLLCAVPDDESVPSSQDAGVPVVERRPDSGPARAYVEGAATIAESITDASASGSDDETTELPPSKESLEARGWLFPGESDRTSTVAIESRGATDRGATDQGSTDRETTGVEAGDEVTDDASHDVDDDGIGRGIGDGTARDAGDETPVDPLRRASTDGGSTSLPEADRRDQASGGTVETETPRERRPGEARSAAERDDADERDSTETADDRTDESLAGRVSALLRRSE